jgi:hypothetical protein
MMPLIVAYVDAADLIAAVDLDADSTQGPIAFLYSEDPLLAR